MKYPSRKINKAASLLGKRSAQVRRAKWGSKQFQKKMREWGKLGGRPKDGGKKGKNDERGRN